MAGLLFNEVSQSPPDLEIPPGEVHVWTLNTASEKRAWDRLLSSAEAATADRLSSLYQRRFKSRRAAVRLLLGRYLRLNPTSIEFVLGPNGKPYLAGGQLGFSITHSGDIALIGVGRDCEVGVDVEKLETLADSARLAAQFFTEQETEALSRLGPSMQSSAFLTMWVRKEAALKAEGIPTAIYYPKPLHRQQIYGRFPCADGGLPVTDRIADEVISLPMHAYLDEPTQDRIIAAVRRAVAR